MSSSRGGVRRTFPECDSESVRTSQTVSFPPCSAHTHDQAVRHYPWQLSPMAGILLLPLYRSLPPHAGQTSLPFQTYCEHEFGYHLQELKVLFQGQYPITNEMFFRRDNCPVYTPDGKQAGVLRWEVRVENREEDMQGEQVV